MELPWVIQSVQFRATSHSLSPLWIKLYQLFFHLLDTDSPNPRGLAETVITDVEKRESEIRQISLQKEIWEQSLSAFLFVGRLKNIYW